MISTFRRFLDCAPWWLAPVTVLLLCLQYGRAPPMAGSAGFWCQDVESGRLAKSYRRGEDAFPTKYVLFVFFL